MQIGEGTVEEGIRMTSVVEQRSIDVVPDAERHGSAFSQFTLWLGANLQITAVVTGALAVVFGGGAFWSIIGLLLGNLLGGASWPCTRRRDPPRPAADDLQPGPVRRPGRRRPAAAGHRHVRRFFASGSVLAGEAVGRLTHLGDTTGIVIFALVTAVTTIVGYRLIHTLGRVASIVCALAFVYLASACWGAPT